MEEITGVDVDFYDDILGNINASLSLKVEMRRGRWGAMDGDSKIYNTREKLK